MLPVNGYEDQYTIAPCGRVTRIETGRVVKPTLNKQNGYLYVDLWKNNKGTKFSVHRLVALHYIPNPKDLPFVNHKNSKRDDPHKDNLEWCTQSENVLHGYTHGSMSQEHRRNFKNFELDLLLEAFLSGVSLTTIAKAEKVGLSRMTVNLRERVTETGRLEEYNAEIKRQKTLRNRLAAAATRQAISQYTLDGTWVADHVSMRDAAKALGKRSAGSISNALNPNHPQEKAFGYLWKFN